MMVQNNDRLLIYVWLLLFVHLELYEMDAK